jgi:hypothetical protein
MAVGFHGFGSTTTLIICCLAHCGCDRNLHRASEITYRSFSDGPKFELKISNLGKGVAMSKTRDMAATLQNRFSSGAPGIFSRVSGGHVFEEMNIRLSEKEVGYRVFVVLHRTEMLTQDEREFVTFFEEMRSQLLVEFARVDSFRNIPSITE